MSTDGERRFIFRGPTVGDDMLLRFREPAETVLSALFERIMDGSYDKPFLVEDSEFRSLCFALDGSAQSEMRLDDPVALVSEYTRKMMGFLLFRSRPERILMIGLGGGSLVKYCHKHLSTAKITAVEIDADVIALRSQFLVPPDDSRLRIIHADGVRHVAQMALAKQHTDVMLVDAYDHKGIAHSVLESPFLDNARQILSTAGVFVMNLAVDYGVCARHVRAIRSIFGEPVIAVALQRTGNVVVFAGEALRDRERLRAAIRNSHGIERRLGLQFPNLLRQCGRVRRSCG